MSSPSTTSIQSTSVKRILFVCTGNICRSPTAEYLLKHLAAERHINVDVASRGTNWYQDGDPADRRAIATAALHGVDLRLHVSHPISRQDILDFDLIFCMDINHISQLRDIAPTADSLNKIKLFLRECAPSAGVANVPDPFYDEDEGFERVYRLIELGCKGLLERLAAKTI